MKTIGETIRDLRRSHNITQEALAAMLGVTSQSVSQWENGRTMPDVSLLAPLAHIFDVSADVILGIDIDTKSAQIDALYDEAYTVAASGDHVRAIALADTALGRFPSSYRLMDFYANEVWLYNHICDAAVQDAQRERALAYLERVIGECTEHEIRNNSLMMACLWYHDLGRDTDAERIARTQQGIHFTYGELMGKITHGSRQFAYLRDEMLGQFTCAMGYLMDGLLGCTDDNGNPVYFPPFFEVKKGTAFSCGVTIGEVRKNYIQPHHQFFMALGKCFKRKIELAPNSEELKKYLHGEEISTTCENGWAVVTVCGCAVGGAKAVNGKLKNHYPKGLRSL